MVCSRRSARFLLAQLLLFRCLLLLIQPMHSVLACCFFSSRFHYICHSTCYIVVSRVELSLESLQSGRKESTSCDTVLKLHGSLGQSLNLIFCGTSLYPIHKLCSTKCKKNHLTLGSCSCLNNVQIENFCSQHYNMFHYNLFVYLLLF